MYSLFVFVTEYTHHGAFIHPNLQNVLVLFGGRYVAFNESFSVWEIENDSLKQIQHDPFIKKMECNLKMKLNCFGMCQLNNGIITVGGLDWDIKKPYSHINYYNFIDNIWTTFPKVMLKLYCLN